MDNSKAVSTLNSLVETLKDSEQGFRSAADGLKDPQTRTVFQQFAQERGAMARELQTEVSKLGGTAETSGSLSGSVHRGWVNIKSAITGKDDAGIIAEAERGEDVAKKAFADADVAALPPSARALVQEQAGKVRTVHDRVRAMEKATDR